MQRYFLTNDQMSATLVEITGDDASHIAKVMRMEAGSTVICVNENERVVKVTLTDISQGKVTGHIIEEMEEALVEMPVKVSIAQGLPKGDKLEQIVQKTTELGASSILPFTAKRSIVKWDQKKVSKKIERLQKIAKEAAEQSHRSIVPEVVPPLTVTQLTQSIGTYDLCIVCDEEEAKHGQKSNLKQAFERLNQEMKVLVIIGPEGGLTREETAIFQNEGAISCSIGPRIVRTETASSYVLAALSYQLEI
ncbi:16S rRNA (uracil1498-N3)-methyltransferase [Alkalihalobacillus xiaoxiensis]|uniref:Ribosomal RNA small subunit methyltransferase E n=1 Tax=Shouchella xiaoxiensis TaxID=766895 RepID=A0ABS2SRD3_9BACI|nr:16S rRNA (uracil(1498)-N(3))-methyltransferase [Shouchella xiaoxiensis]MBM7838083.1 16S rRNA (uracil1498-N3)-methyltransferase [Shouchella xiaoxiensis]